MELTRNGKYEKIKQLTGDILCILIIIASTAYFFLNCKTYSVMDGDFGSGAVEINYRNYLAFREGKICLWNNYEWGGIPALGHTVFQVIYPVYFAIFAFIGSDFGLFLPMSYTFHMSLMGVGLFLFNRVNKLRTVPSFAAAVVVMTSTEFIAQIGWPYLFTAYAWLPLTLAAVCLFERTEERGKCLLYIALASLCLGFSGLANQGQTLLINILMVAMFYFCYILTNRNKKYIKGLTLKYVVFAVMSFSLCAPALLPAVEFAKNCARFVPDMGLLDASGKLTPDVFTKYSASIAGMLGSMLQIPQVNTHADMWNCSYTAAAISVFGLIGLSVKKKEEQRSVSFFNTVVFVFVIMYSCSVIWPYIFINIPGFNAIREPFLYIPYLIIPVSFFTGCGFDKLFEFSGSLRQQQSEFRFYKLALFLLALMLFGTTLPYAKKTYNIILAFSSAALFAGAFIIRKKNYRNTAVTLALLLLGAGQFRYNISMLHFPNDRFEIMEQMETQQHSLSEALRPLEAEPAKYEKIRTFGTDGWAANSWSMLGKSDSLGYMNPLTRLNPVLNGIDWYNQAVLKNIRVWYTSVDKEDYYHAILNDIGRYMGTVETFTSYAAEEKTPADVYVVDTPGLAWCVNHTMPADDSRRLPIQTITDLINGSGADFTAQAFVNSDSVNVESDTNVWSVTVTDYQSNYIDLAVNTAENTLLVLSEVWYPGWKAYVDGVQTEVLQADYTNRSCIVPAGSHNVRFSYEPALLRIGIVMLCAVWTAAAALYIRELIIVRRGKNGKNSKADGSAAESAE